MRKTAKAGGSTGVWHWVLAAMAIPAMAAQAAAAVATPDAGQILQEQRRVPPTLAKPSSDASVHTDIVPDTTPRQDDGASRQKVLVKAFHFSGDVVVPVETLQSLLKDRIGNELDFGALRKAAERVTQYLHNKGYILARAYLPPQEVRDGEVEIAIRVGTVDGAADGIAIKAPKGLRLGAGRIRKTLTSALSDGGSESVLPLKMDRLERGMLLLNDTPGIAARSTLERGSRPDSTKLTVDVTEGRLLTGGAWIDNDGDRYTGSFRRSALVSINDPGSIGDQAVVSATWADRLMLGQIDYGLPIGYRGLRLQASYSHLHYRIGEELAPLDAKGDASTTGVDLRYPVIRSRDRNLFVGADFDFKALEDESSGIVTSDRRVDVWNLIVNGSETDDAGGGGLTTYALVASRGRLDLSRVPDSLAADRATWNTNGTYVKAAYSLSRLQRLGGNWTLLGAFRGQLANSNLGSSEQLILGGPYGVRAYPPGEAAGDAGWVATLELHYDLPEPGWLGNVQLTEFFDSGRVVLHHDTGVNPAWVPGALNGYSLSGAGLGINFGKVGLYTLRAAYAWKVGSNPGRSAQGLDSDGTNHGGRFWMQVAAQF